MKVLVKSAWGSDDPTKAAFPFLHAGRAHRDAILAGSERREDVDARFAGRGLDRAVGRGVLE